MIDPITLEVIRETLVSTVREMRVTLVRTAYSSILYEGEDFSLRAHGRRGADRGHVQGRRPSAAHRADQAGR